MAFRKHLMEQNLNELYLNARFEIISMLLIITPYNLYTFVRFAKKFSHTKAHSSSNSTGWINRHHCTMALDSV